jgi:hypothetical protein
MVPANYAKQLLFSFVESRRGSVNVTYMLAGWTKAEASQHQISIVGEGQLKVQTSSLTVNGLSTVPPETRDESLDKIQTTSVSLQEQKNE